MRRMWIPRMYLSGLGPSRLNEGGLLPGGHTVFTYESRQHEVDYMRDSLATHFLPYPEVIKGIKYYAPGY